MILDTSSLINRVKAGKEISENITVVTILEYPPIMNYEKFHGEIFFITYEDQIRAFTLQRKLREIGRPLSVGDLLIVSICINRGETLTTKDKIFKNVAKIVLIEE
ncbi:MAG: DNA-binding protein [Thermoprotei archaeon]|nr:MAG: DNA-binding protein [Thermoprotei archaeon]